MWCQELRNKRVRLEDEENEDVAFDDERRADDMADQAVMRVFRAMFGEAAADDVVCRLDRNFEWRKGKFHVVDQFLATECEHGWDHGFEAEDLPVLQWLRHTNNKLVENTIKQKIGPVVRDLSKVWKGDVPVFRYFEFMNSRRQSTGSRQPCPLPAREKDGAGKQSSNPALASIRARVSPTRSTGRLSPARPGGRASPGRGSSPSRLSAVSGCQVKG